MEQVIRLRKKRQPTGVTPESFWGLLKQDEKSGCLNWIYGKHPFGYGTATYQQKHQTTHRIAWIFKHGEIPKGMYVLHRCDNPSCCNPHHLFLGTPQDNMDDMRAKGRDRKDPLRGSAHPNHKLTEKDVATIRSVYVKGRPNTRSENNALSLSKKYGVARSLIQRIVTGQSRRYA